MGYGTLRPETGKPEEIKIRKQQTLTEWITDVCRVKECREGFVSKEVRRYSTLFACTLCDRAYEDGPGRTPIPSIKRWPGTLEMRTDAELEAVMKNRAEVVEKIRAGDRKSWVEVMEEIDEQVGRGSASLADETPENDGHSNPF